MDIRTFYIYIFWLNIHFYHQIIYFYHTYLNSSSFQERMRPEGDLASLLLKKKSSASMQSSLNPFTL